MKKISIPAGVSRRVAMATLKTQKHSPTILFAVGIVGMGATVITACKATLKVEGVLDDHQTMVETIKTVEISERYSEKDRKQDLTKLHIRSAGRLSALYAPSVALGIISVAALTGSHKILSSRNAALTASYAAVDKAFKEYRTRVTEELGEDKDREFRYGVETETRMVEDKNGPKKKEVKVAGSGRHSMYARMFNEYNPNWNNHAEYNIAFLRLQQNWANDRLRSRGHLFLNEVYDQLGMDHSKEGAVVGWLWNQGTGDDYVDFGIWSDKSMEGTLNFVNGWENELLLDFNVDGTIWDKI
jgi:hypothetical protein